MELNSQQRPTHHKTRSSPLRIKLIRKSDINRDSISGQQKLNICNEEDSYNKKRQDALRKQLKQNDVNGDLSPLSSSNYDSKMQQYYSTNDRSNNYPEKPPSNYFTLGPPNQPTREEPLNGPPPHIIEHISNLQNENQSLMRRLNLVMQELDRIKREKSDLQHRLDTADQEYRDIKRILNNDDNDKVNNYMQEDLEQESEQNYKIKQQIKDLDNYKNNLIIQLRDLQQQKEKLTNDHSDISFDLQQKIQRISDIEEEKSFTTEKIRALNIAIDNCRREQKFDTADNHQLEGILNQLKAERNDLQQKLDQLTLKYDECVIEISQDRAIMQNHNTQHAKLITSKIIFQLLESLMKNKLRQGFQEIQTYCSFDNKCHMKLSQFSRLLHKLGNYKQRNALRKWFINVLQPLKARDQSIQLAQAASNLSLKGVMFRKWLDLYKIKVSADHSKFLAIQKLKSRAQKETQIETKRAFQIWKDDQSNLKLKQSKIKKLIWKLHFAKISHAMNVWINYNNNIGSQVRLNLLSKEFTQKQYLTLMFYNFKYQVTLSKTKRQNILFHCIKAWKDYLAYQKFMMGSNLTAFQFKAECNLSIVKASFDALKQNKDQEKYERTHKILNEDERPKISQLQNETKELVKQKDDRLKRRALDVVQRMLSRNIYGYFLQWKNMNENYKEKLRTTVRDRVIRLYILSLRKAFTHWKMCHKGNKIEQHQMVICENHEEASNLQNEVMQMQKEIKEQKESRDCSQKKSMNRCLQKMMNRMLEQAMARWRDQVTDMNIKEDGSAVILKRLRLRMLRNAFNRYKDAVIKANKEVKDEERLKQFLKIRNERLSQKVFDAWLIYKNNFTKAKDYWYRIYLRLDLTMKQAAIKKWKSVTQARVEKSLQQKQDSSVETIEQKTHELGKIIADETIQKNQITQLKGKLTTQGQRIIANAFARYYYVNETRGFEKWKEYVQFEKNKEKLLKKFLDHLRKYQYNSVRSCFKNMVLATRVNEKRVQLKREELECSDANFQLEHQTKMFKEIKQKLENEGEQTIKMQDMFNSRLQKSVGMIMKKACGNHFTSRKRFIFQQWRQHVKREVNFMNCIRNVIQKSQWNYALEQIKSQSKEVHRQRQLETVLDKFRMKFWKATCGNAFSVWRSGQYAIVSTSAQAAEQTKQRITDEYSEQKKLFKKINATRSAKLILRQNLRNLFQSWKNVIAYWKKQKETTVCFKQETDENSIRNALRKWNGRKDATKLARLRMKKLKEKVQQIRLRQYFYAFKFEVQNTKEFCQRMSNLANIHDQQALKVSFNAIISYAKAKAFVYQKRKETSSQLIQSILGGLLQRKMKGYFDDFKMQCLNRQREQYVKGLTILYNAGNKLRYFFQQWKQWSDNKTLTLQINTEGPLREQVFEQNMQLKNLKDFMHDEGYEERDVQNALKTENQRQKDLILKALRRMQHYNEDLYLKPKVFDRWKMFVQMRKAFKYWLGYVDKRAEVTKSELHWSFDLWKNYKTRQQEELQQLSKEQLEKRIMKNTGILEKVAEKVDEKENEVKHLNDQREELVENYVKAQRLALSLWVNHQQKTLQQAFLRWSKTTKTTKNMSTTEMLRKNLELIENLKNRISQLENNNETIAAENEELRQFSLDGYEMAKNVQNLTEEREKLSVDLADKAQMIRNLLVENDQLNGKLSKAQEEASILIQSTMAGSSGFKTANKSGYSPLNRSSIY